MSAQPSDVDMLIAVATGDNVAAATRATRELAQRDVPPAAMRAVLNASINCNDSGFLDAAAGLAVTAPLSVAERIHVAWRLAIAGFGERSLAVLLCDPRMLQDGPQLNRTFGILGLVKANAPAGSLARQQATALSRRLLPVDSTPPELSQHRFMGDAGAAPQVLGPPLEVHATPGVPAIIRNETATVIKEMDLQLARMRHPQVQLLRDVYVNRLGQIWRQDGKAVRHYNSLIPASSRAAEATASIVEEAALAIEMHNNLYHWLGEWFPSIAWRLDDATSTMPVLIRDDAASFVGESIALAAKGNVTTITAGDAVLVRRLHLVNANLALLARAEAVSGPMHRLRERALASHGASGGARQPIYISRRDSRKRPMANEAELEEALAKRGYDTVTMSGRPLAEQVAMVCQAGDIIAPHGAALALLAAATPGQRVIELVPALSGSMVLRTNMGKISRIVGHDHCLWLQDIQTTGGAWSIALDDMLALVDARTRRSGP